MSRHTYRREGGGRFVVRADAQRVGSSATKRGAMALVVALEEGMIRRVVVGGARVRPRQLPLRVAGREGRLRRVAGVLRCAAPPYDDPLMDREPEYRNVLVVSFGNMRESWSWFERRLVDVEGSAAEPGSPTSAPTT